jgi:Tol biopolymer transport system component
MDANGQNKRVLTETFDRTPFGLMWSEDGDDIYFSTEDKGTNNLYSVRLRGAKPRQLTKGNHQLLLQYEQKRRRYRSFVRR